MLRTTAFILLAAGCSASVSFSISGQSPGDAAEDLIEDELADDVGLGILRATCDDEGADEIGDGFSCTAETADGQTIQFFTVIDRENHIDVASTNLITNEALQDLEEAGVRTIAENLGTTFATNSIDCGTGPLILEDGLEFVCAFSDPESSDAYDVTFELPDTDSGDFEIRYDDEELLSSIYDARPVETAIQVIEEEFPTRFDLDELVATCEDNGASEIGDQFACTAETSSGQTINFLVDLDSEEHVNVHATNLLTTEDLVRYEQAAAILVGGVEEVVIPEDAFDCGDKPIIFEAELDFVCTFSDPDSSDVYDVTFELPDIPSGRFDLQFAEAPNN